MEWFSGRSQSEGPSADELEAHEAYREQYGDDDFDLKRNTQSNQRGDLTDGTHDNDNSDEDKRDRSPEPGVPIDLKSTFRDLAPPKKKKIFQTADSSKLHGMFGTIKKDSNLKLQRKMMAKTYGAVKDLPTGADMNLSTLAQATRLGLPHMISHNWVDLHALRPSNQLKLYGRPLQ